MNSVEMIRPNVELAEVRKKLMEIYKENDILKRTMTDWAESDRSTNAGYFIDRDMFTNYCRFCLTKQERLRKGIAYMLPEDTQ